MIKYLIIFFLFGFPKFYAQPKSIVVVIDTLIFQCEADNFIKLRVSENELIKIDFDSLQQISLTEYPNFSCNIILNNSGSVIEIPVDKNGSHLKLTNVYNFTKDTLTINKLTIFDTKLADSTFTSVIYTKKINGILAEKPYKIKVKKSGTSFLSPPQMLEFNVDGKQIDAAFRLTSERNLVFHGHGHKPKKIVKKSGKDKKRIKYIFIDKGTYKYYWISDVKLLSE